MMNDKTKVIPKGGLFTITQGRYSDYGTLALCRALKDIDVSAAQEEYLAKHPEQRVEYALKESQVISWLINIKEWAEEIDFFELHLGSSSNADFTLSYEPIETT